MQIASWVRCILVYGPRCQTDFAVSMTINRILIPNVSPYLVLVNSTCVLREKKSVLILDYINTLENRRRCVNLNNSSGHENVFLWCRSAIQC